jgi:hypothetical protein
MNKNLRILQLQETPKLKNQEELITQLQKQVNSLQSENALMNCEIEIFKDKIKQQEKILKTYEFTKVNKDRSEEKTDKLN